MNGILSLVIIGILGISVYSIAKKVRIPPPLALIVLGMVISKTGYFVLPETFIPLLIFFGVALVVFDTFARINIKQFDSISHEAMTIAIYFAVFTLVSITIVSYYTVTKDVLGPSLLFAALMVGTASINEFKIKRRHYYVLDEESRINRAISLAVAFAIGTFYLLISKGLITDDVWSNLLVVFLRLMLGAGSGMLIGIILFKLVKEKFFVKHRHLLLLLGVISSYSLAYLVNGEPIFSVMLLGLLFGSWSLDRKHELYEFSEWFAEGIELWIFIAAGIIISFKFSSSFIIDSLIIFFIFKFSRFVAINAALHHHKYSLKEKIFMTLNSSKGIAVITAVLALMMDIYNIPRINIIAEYLLVISLYTLVVSAITDIASKRFIGVDD